MNIINIEHGLVNVQLTQQQCQNLAEATKLAIDAKASNPHLFEQFVLLNQLFTLCSFTSLLQINTSPSNGGVK